MTTCFLDARQSEIIYGISVTTRNPCNYGQWATLIGTRGPGVKFVFENPNDPDNFESDVTDYMVVSAHTKRDIGIPTGILFEAGDSGKDGWSFDNVKMDVYWCKGLDGYKIAPKMNLATGAYDIREKAHEVLLKEARANGVTNINDLLVATAEIGGLYQLSGNSGEFDGATSLAKLPLPVTTIASNSW